jgi:hypothetical protein
MHCALLFSAVVNALLEIDHMASKKVYCRGIDLDGHFEQILWPMVDGRPLQPSSCNPTLRQTYSGNQKSNLALFLV